jgi:hypothetical protein
MLWKAPRVEEVLHSTKDNSILFRGAPGLTMPHVLSLSYHSYFAYPLQFWTCLYLGLPLTALMSLVETSFD